MTRLFILLLAIPLCATAQNKAKTASQSAVPTVLVRETCEPPTEPVGRSVFAITCGGDEVLLMMTIREGGKKQVFWERHPAEELKRLTEGVNYQVVREK